MKNKTEGTFLQKYFSTILYVAINILFIAIFLVLAYVPETSKAIAKVVDIENGSVELLITSQISIVTIMVTIELTVKQLLFRSRNQKLFSHVPRVVFTIFFFFVIFICVFVSSNRFNLRLFSVFYSVVFSIVSLIFFIFDLARFTIGDIINAEAKRMARRIKKEKSIEDSFKKLTSLYREALPISDTDTFDKIMFSLFKEVFVPAVQYKKANPSSIKDETIRDLYNKIKGLTDIEFSLLEGGKESYFIKASFSCKCSLLNCIYYLGDQEVVDEYEIYGNLRLFYESIPDMSQYVIPFVDSIFNASPDHLNERLIFILSIIDDAHKRSPINCDYIFESAILKIDDGSIDRSEDNLEKLLNYLGTYLFDFDVYPGNLENILSELWRLFETDECRKLILEFVSFENKSFKNLVNAYSGVHLFLEKIKNENGEYLFDICQINLFNNICLLANKPNDGCLLFEINNDLFGDLFDLYVAYVSLVCFNSPTLLVQRNLSVFTAYASKTTDDDQRLELFKILDRCFQMRDFYNRSENMIVVVQCFVDMLKMWIVNQSLSDDLASQLINMIFGDLQICLFEELDSIKDIFMILGNPFSNGEFLNNFVANKYDRFSDICGAALTLGLSGIEYKNDFIIRHCSNIIGNCLLKSLECSSLDLYENILNNAALPLFRNSIDLYDREDTSIFISSIYSITFSQLLDGGNSDHTDFVKNQINKVLNDKELLMIRNGIILRNNTEEYSQLLKLLDKRLKK